MIRDFLFLGAVKRRLVDGTLPNTQAFLYFAIITAVDNLQLAVLQVSPAQPTPWTPFAVWGSLLAGGVFLIGTYLLNGGSAGRDYLPRYFAITAVVALWIAIPFQLAISLPSLIDALAAIEWYVPAVLLITTVTIFTVIAVQIRDVAIRSRHTAVSGSG